MKYIVANHKNYLTLDEVLEYTSKLIPCKNNNLIICPSDMFLHLFKSDKYYLGSQYVSNTIPPASKMQRGILYEIVKKLKKLLGNPHNFRSCFLCTFSSYG